jgi:XRE family transcriptional regulator
MNQIKIGKFIAECRKNSNLTQMQLAEKLNITDRAISKWENGKAMPDSSIMLDLCKELKISVNELLSGEMIDMKNYNKIAEENLFKLNESNEKKKKIMLKSAIVIGLLIFIIIVIQLYSYTKQISKSNLNNVLEQAQQNQKIYIKIQELEERVNELEKNVSH